MITHRNSPLATPRLEVIIKTLAQAAHGRFGRAVGVPSPGSVVADASHAGGHAEPGCEGGELDLVVWRAGGEGGGFFGEEFGEVFYEEEGADGVDFEALEALCGVDLRGVLLDV